MASITRGKSEEMVRYLERASGVEELPLETASCREFKVESYREFLAFILHFSSGYIGNDIWRGHRKSTWGLVSKLYRQLASDWVQDDFIARRLSMFKSAVSGLRGTNPPALKDDDAWWALARHHGLATPFLDWTRSAYVALFFAFESSLDTEDGTDSECSVINLNATPWKGFQSTILGLPREDEPGDDGVEILSPVVDENRSMIAQAGVFTRTKRGKPVEDVVSEFVSETPGYDESSPILLKFHMPRKDRADCLNTLDHMNVNHLTLFPDLYGAARHCDWRHEAFSRDLPAPSEEAGR